MIDLHEEFEDFLPSGYVYGRLDALKQVLKPEKQNRPTRPGYVWVEDRRVKKGGYWRKNPHPSSNQTEIDKEKEHQRNVLIGSALAGTALLGAGAIATIGFSRSSTGGGGGAPPPNAPPPKNPQEPPKPGKTVEDLEREMEEERVEAQMKAEEERRKATEEAERASSEEELQKEVEKKQGKKEAVDEELEKMKQERSQKRAEEVGDQIPEYTGSSEERAPIQFDRNGEIDVKKTLTTLGIGNHDSPVVDINTVAQSIKDHHAKRLEEEYAKGLHEITKGHNKAYGGILSDFRARYEPGGQERMQAGKDRIKAESAARVKEFTKQFNAIRDRHNSLIEESLRQFAHDSNESQRYGRPMDKDRQEYFNQAFNSQYLTRRSKETSDQVNQQIKRNSRGKPIMGREESESILKDANEVLKRIGKKPVRLNHEYESSQIEYFLI